MLTLQLILAAFYLAALVYSLRIYSKPLYAECWLLGLWEWLVAPLVKRIRAPRLRRLRQQAKSMSFSLAQFQDSFNNFGLAISRQALAFEELQLKSERALQTVGLSRGEARWEVFLATERAKNAAIESFEPTEWHLRRELGALERRYLCPPVEPSKLTIQELTKAWREAWPEIRSYAPKVGTF